MKIERNETTRKVHVIINEAKKERMIIMIETSLHKEIQ